MIQLLDAEKRVRLIFCCFVFNKSLRNTDVLEYLFVNYIFISCNTTNSTLIFNCRRMRNLFCIPHFKLILFQRLCCITYIPTFNTSPEIFDKLRETYFRLGHTKKKHCYYGAEIRIEINFAKLEFRRRKWFRECCKLRHYLWYDNVRVLKDSAMWILGTHILTFWSRNFTFKF